MTTLLKLYAFLALFLLFAACSNKSTDFQKVSRNPDLNESRPISPTGNDSDEVRGPGEDIPVNTLGTNEPTPAVTPNPTPVVTPTPVIVPTVTYVPVKEVFTQNDHPTADILWVVDNSGSMGNEQAELAMHFDRFINKFIKKEVQFRMAITTTDPRKSRNNRDGRDGSIICDWHKLTAEAARSNENKFKKDFKKCINVGIEGHGEEQGLNAASRFAQRYGNAGGYNPFMRKKAHFIVIIVSDENDHNTLPVKKYVQALAKAKGYEWGKVKIYSIINTSQSQIRTSYESVGHRYRYASELTRGKVASIRSNFSQTLANFSDDILNLLEQFQLEKVPSFIQGHDQIKVKVNGVETKEFTYIKESNSIRFHAWAIPEPGSSIEVSFEVAEE